MSETNEPAHLPAPRPLEAGGAVAAIIPRTLTDVARVGDAILRAGLAPTSYIVKPKGTNDEATHQADQATKARVMIGIMKGAEVGLPPITALSTIAIINNRPCIWGDGAVALVQQSGLVERIETFYEGGNEAAAGPVQEAGGEINHAPTLRDFPQGLTAVCRIWRRGQSAPYEGRFSVRDAMRAHLWGNSNKAPWVEYPKRMLMNRARAFPLRDGFADVLCGLSIREEVEDFPAEPARVADVSFLDDTPRPRLMPPEPAEIDHAFEPARERPQLPDADPRGATSPPTDRPLQAASPEGTPPSAEFALDGAPPVQLGLATMRVGRLPGSSRSDWQGYAMAMLARIEACEDLKELQAGATSKTLDLLRTADHRLWTEIMSALKARERDLYGSTG
jgi:hypothetical protein